VRAMVLQRPGEPLAERELPDPEPAEGEVVVAVEACGVCRTDLHVVDGELREPKLPLVPGHQAVGRVVAIGGGVEERREGDRVGVPWLAWACGVCERCREGRENLCPRAVFTGYTADGGYAERLAVDARFALPLDDGVDAVPAAPLLCAGLIGYRALRMCGDATRIGLYGFGSSAHLICQLLVHEEREAFAFTRDGDEGGQEFARSLGAAWAGGSGDLPPQPLDAAIVFAPIGELVPAALRAVRPGGVVVCAGIHMSDIPSFPYELLWQERELRSVANLTRRDGLEFLPRAADAGIAAETTIYALAAANEALDDLRSGRVQGSAVLTIA
jgi:propanol-preferring alcohol dehydrogenase